VRWAASNGRLDRSEHLVLGDVEASVDAAIGKLDGDPPGLVGLRFGGYLAIRALLRGRATRAVVWEPVLQPEQYVRELVRVALANQLTTYGTVRHSADVLMENARRTGYLLVDGYRLSRASIEDLEKAPGVTPESAAGCRQSLSLVFWRSRRACERWKDAGFDAIYLPAVKLAWDNIRYFDAKPAELYDATTGRLQQ
jgi:hypothetical protein